MSNISIATFQCGSRSCKLYGLWQYDYGQILRIQDLGLPPAVEIHFSLTEKGGTSVTRVGTTKDGVTDVVIPDSLLENDDASQDYWIYAFVYLTDDDSGSTEYKIAMKVKSRPRPEAIDRPGDQELFREAIAAVNEAAERAENAVNNLNADVSEKVTRPDTAEVGQALVVKEIDETGKPTTFEAQDMVEVSEWAQKPEKPTYTAKEVGALPDDTKIPTNVSELENDSGYLTKPYDDTELKTEIATKITAPENPEVGKVFKIKSVNDDGTFIGEWADGGVANLDVQIDGKSIVENGIAEIPLCTKTLGSGLITIDIYSNDGGLYRANRNTGLIRVAKASNNSLDERTNNYCPIVPVNLDYAVKAAMCDGKGAVWTADEQAAARERMGIDEWESILDITLEEESSFSADFEHEYKKLYIYIDQSGVSEKICSSVYCCPYSAVNADDKKINSFHSYYQPTTNSFFNISAYWESYGSITKRIMNTINNQTETTGNACAYAKSWDTSVCDRVGIGKPFKGIYPSITIFKPGTRIVIKGVRA